MHAISQSHSVTVEYSPGLLAFVTYDDVRRAGSLVCAPTIGLDDTAKRRSQAARSLPACLESISMMWRAKPRTIGRDEEAI